MDRTNYIRDDQRCPYCGRMGSDDHVETIELDRLGRTNVALRITVSELEEQLADARGKLERLESAEVRGAERYMRIVETTLRGLGAREVRFWGSPSDRDPLVTLTLRNGRGEIHAETLAAAIQRAAEVSR